LYGNFFAINKDSLIKIINNTNAPDTTRFSAYYELGWEMIYTSSDSTYLLAKKAFVIARASKLKIHQTKVLNLMGAYFQIKADYLQAIDYYQKSLKIGEEINNVDAVLVANGNIGALYLLLGQHKKGLEYQMKSLALAEKSGKKQKLGSIYNNLCLAYFNFGELQKSVEFGLKSLENYKEFSDKNGICSATGNLGNAYTGLKEYDKALENFMTCYTLAKEISNTYEQSRAALDIGYIYIEEKKYQEAIRFFTEAQKLASDNEDEVNTRDSHLGLYKSYKAMGDNKKSLECYEKYNELNAAINKEEKEEAVNRKEMEFEFNKRTVRDSIKNAEERKVQDVLLEANKAQIEKDKILKIVLTVGLILVIGFGILIFNRFRITRKQKIIIELKNKQTEEQKEIIENKNKEILDSINYAKRIQYTLLAHAEFLRENLPEHFVLFRPKDIVSGDYYWAVKKDHLFYLACCDSTGHGVPGAFMSLLNIGFLSEAINEKNILDPDKVFNYVRDRLINSISKEEQKDGFDGILMCFNKKTNRVTYVGANSEPVFVSNGGLVELPCDKMPVGKGELEKSFSLHEINVKPGDSIYLFTDGYADQFGGPKGKKFKYKQLEELLLNCHTLSVDEQKEKIDTAFLSWKGDLEQIDDVCVIGIKF
jgi:serine phosphatase RsbU (regulator of sigma subunit)